MIKTRLCVEPLMDLCHKIFMYVKNYISVA